MLMSVMIRTALLGLAAAAALTAADRPNVLFLFADDHRPDAIGAWGNPHIQTPNLDRLVHEGFSFRRAYCLGSNSGAVCLPSRAMLNSGKAYFRIQPDLAGERTLGELLQQSGYKTFATGKWHNQRPAWLRSFGAGKSVMFGGMSDHTDVPVEDLGAGGKLLPGRNGRKFSSEMFADNAVEFLDNYRDSAPFYAYIAFTAPHDPRQPPRRYRDFYYRSRPPLPPNFLPQHPFDNGEMVVRDEELAAWPRTSIDVSDQLAEYYGLIGHLDEQIGRILAALERSPHGKNTYVVYAADHGLAVGSHGLLGKQNLYEHSMGAPLIVRGPDAPRGGQSRAFAYLYDLFPTILGLAGASAPQGLDGLDLRPVWRGEKASVRDSVFLAYRDVMRAVNDGRWKLILYPAIAHAQLFDLDEDPHEMRSLADDPAQRERIAGLTERLRDWQRRLGDNLELTAANPKPKEIDLTGRKRTVDPWQPMWIIEKYFPDWF
jgi:arylsulfatase A-like enzyme